MNVFSSRRAWILTVALVAAVMAGIAGLLVDGALARGALTAVGVMVVLSVLQLAAHGRTGDGR